MIFLTDGQSNIKYWDTKPAAKDLKATGAKVIAISIGVQDDEEVTAITSPNQVYKIDNFKELKDLEQKVLEGSCGA